MVESKTNYEADSGLSTKLQENGGPESPRSSIADPIITERAKVANTTSHKLRDMLSQEEKETFDSSPGMTHEYLESLIECQGEKAQNKLKILLNWRKSHGINALPRSKEQLEKFEECRELRQVVEEESYLSWRGFDNQGRPVLWVRLDKKGWKRKGTKVDILYHALMFDLGIEMMGPGVTQIVLAVDSYGMGPRHADLGMAKELIHMLKTGYCDRLGALMIMPTPWAFRACFKLVKPLLPQRVAGKVYLHSKKSGFEALRDLEIDQFAPETFGEAEQWRMDDGGDLLVQMENQLRL